MEWGALRHRARVPVGANVERPTTALLAWEFGASGPSGSPDVSAGGSRSFLTTGQRRAVTAPVEQAQGDEVVGGPEPVGHGVSNRSFVFVDSTTALRNPPLARVAPMAGIS